MDPFLDMPTIQNSLRPVDNTPANAYAARFQNSRNADRYARRFEAGRNRRIDRREQAAVEGIFRALTDCASVLDVPCGAGRFAATLAGQRRQVIGADVAAEILAHARIRAERDSVDAEFIQADAAHLPLPDAAVDCLFSNRLLHHFRDAGDRAAFLREFHRVTRRWLVVSFFDYQAFGWLRRLLKRFKGRRPPYGGQPTLGEFTAEVELHGFRVRLVVLTGAPWVSQKYLLLEKRAVNGA